MVVFFEGLTKTIIKEKFIFMEEKFFVKDVNLAAYFIANGIEFIDVENSDGKCIFNFPKNDELMKAFSNFKRDAWLKNYNEAKRNCLQVMREIRNQVN